jgi:hypothetical protein
MSLITRTDYEKMKRRDAGVMEWWRIGKYQIPSTKSQGVRCRVSGVREEKNNLKSAF